MKRIYSAIIFLLLLIIVNQSFSQGLILSKADRKFDQLAFAQAITLYETLTEKGDTTLHICQRLAVSYRMIRNTEKAEYWYKQLIDRGNVAPDNLYYYSEALRSNGKLDESEKWIKKYASLNPFDSRTKHKRGTIEYVQELMKDSAAFFINNLNTNTPNSDFGPAYYKDELIFASARSKREVEAVKRIYPWNNQYYLDLYAGIRQNTGMVDSLKLFSNLVNSRFNDADVTFENGDSVIYFTRNNYLNNKETRGKDGTDYLMLCRAELKKGRWENIYRLPFNDDNFSTGHPTFNATNDTLYFASDRPGGFGGTDLYYSVHKNKHEWAEPVNLGQPVNTEGNEMFPFIHKDGTLYFASDGQSGLGGLDIFYTRNQMDGQWGKANNMGYPINSLKDDFALIIDPVNEHGYFSSNRPGGKGDDDIYYFEIKINDPPLAKNDIFEIDQNQPLKLNPLVNDNDPNKDSIFITSIAPKSLHGGRISFNAAKDSVIYIPPKDFTGVDSVKYIIEDKSKFSPKKSEAYIVVTINKIQEPSAIDKILAEFGELKKDKKIILRNIYYDLDKWNIRPDAAVELDKVVIILKEYPKMKIELSSHTDCRAPWQYNQVLSQRRAESAVKYISSKGVDRIRMIAKGFGETMLVNECKDSIKCTEDQHQLNRRTEIVILEM